MPRRPRHKCKEVEAVLVFLERSGWRIVYPSGHWGRWDVVSCDTWVRDTHEVILRRFVRSLDG